jgi:hypothetical protein
MASTRGRKHRSATQWQKLLDRFAASGLKVADFCQSEGICEASFYRWRSLLGNTHQTPSPAARHDAPEFVDLGTLSPPSASRLDIRLELGGGIVLHLVRG